MGLWQDKVSDQGEGIALEKYQNDLSPQAWALGIGSTNTCSWIGLGKSSYKDARQLRLSVLITWTIAVAAYLVTGPSHPLPTLS